MRNTAIAIILSSAFAFAQLPPGLGNPDAEGDEGIPSPKNLTQVIRTPDPNAIFNSEINFRNLTGTDAAALYQTLTGKRLLVSSAAANAEVSFVQAPGLTYREAARLLEETFLMEGFQITPWLRDPNIMKLVAATTPGGPANVVAPAPVVDDAALLGAYDGVVTYVMTFQYLKPSEAQRTFTQVFAQFRPGGTIAEVPNASSLIITEKAELIQRMVKLKESIDVATATLATEFVAVQYADVQELAEQLNEMFNNSSSQNSARVQRTQNVPNPLANAVNNAQGGGTAGEETPPTITPDSRTNRIFLMGRPVDLVFIKDLIAKWDVPSDQRNFLRRKLRYLPVYEFVPIAEAAIGRTLGESSSTGGSGSLNRPTPTSTNNNTASNSRSNTNSTNSRTSSTSSSSGGFGSGGASALSGQARPTEPQSTVVGNTLLVSDNVSNSVIVQGPPHHIEIVENLLAELDVKNEQVAITAVFGRFTVEDDLSFGVNLAKLLQGNGIGIQTRNGSSFVNPETIDAFADLVTSGSSFNLQGISGNFGVFVNAVETYTNFRATARPTIFTTNNTEARISSGQQIAVPTNSFQNSVGNNSVNVEYRDVALELLVRPLVNSSDEITLEISVGRSSVGNDREISSDLTIPDLLLDEVNTRVTIPNGAVVLLGGLIEEEERDTESGVPILRSIPLLGNLFKQNSDQFDRNELVIMIRPVLVDGIEAVNQYQQVYDYGSNLSQSARSQFSKPAYKPRKNTLNVFSNDSLIGDKEQSSNSIQRVEKASALPRKDKLALEKDLKPAKRRTSFSQRHKR